jgi:hypothetical protein
MSEWFGVASFSGEGAMLLAAELDHIFRQQLSVSGDGGTAKHLAAAGLFELDGETRCGIFLSQSGGSSAPPAFARADWRKAWLASERHRQAQSKAVQQLAEARKEIARLQAEAEAKEAPPPTIIVNVPQQPPPVVNVAPSPVVNNVTVPDRKVLVEFQRDRDGRLSGATGDEYAKSGS